MSNIKKNHKKLEILVKSQFIKDMSLENFRTNERLPNSEKINYNLSINVLIEKEKETVSQVILKLVCEANDEKGSIFILEIEYGGNFEINSIEKKEKQKILMVDCPKLLFPFLRRLAYDITREGGLTPLNIQPIDFESVKLSS